jgi:transcription elongation factor GreA
MVVTVSYGPGDQETFLIGSREEAAVTDITVYSAQSPLGQALTGAKPGESVSYQAPNGKQISLELISAEPYTG